MLQLDPIGRANNEISPKMFWQDWRRKNNIFSLTLWIYLLSKLYGNWSFSIEFDAKRHSSRVRVTPLDWLRFIFNLIFYINCTRYIIHEDAEKNLSTKLEVSITQFAQLISLLVLILSIVLDMINRNALWNIILKFDEFDLEVSVNI